MSNGSVNKPWAERFSGRVLFGAMLCLSMVLCVPSRGQTAQTPVDAVHATVDEVLYLLTELKESSRAGQRQWEIEQVVRRAFHYEAMAERALGEIGTQATPADRRQFVRLFVQVLRDDVIDQLRDYAVDQVVYLAEERDAEGVQVLLAPAGLGNQTRMAFHVVTRDGRWVVDDVSIDGASIVSRYHQQFTRILREGSFSDLMDYLKTKAPVA